MTRRKISTFLSLLLILMMILPSAIFGSSMDNVQLNSKLNPEAVSMMEEIIERYNTNKTFIHPSLNELNKDIDVIVIVELSELPVSVQKGMYTLKGKNFSVSSERNVLSRINAQQNSIQANLSSKGIDYEITEKYSYAINGLAIKINSNNLKELSEIKDIKGIYPNIEYKVEPINIDKLDVNMHKSAPYIGADEVWKLGFEGEGVKVGVIDTGIDYLHPDLKDAYKGGYDFVNSDDDPYETMPGERPEGMPEIDENYNTYYTSHGTHVAGTVGGRGIGPMHVKGIAPKADIYAYKVLGPYGRGQTDWVLGGIDRAVADKMDVINLSLGSDNNDPDFISSVALNNSMLAGVITVTANGNAGPKEWTVGSPGASTFAISVGASSVTSTDTNLKGEITVGENPATINNLHVMAKTLNSDVTELGGAHESVFLGIGDTSDFEAAGDINGKVAIVKRGDIPFIVKIQNAKAAGAKAIIIYNNVEGNSGYVFGNSFDYVPTFEMSGEDGQAFENLMNVDSKQSININFSDFVVTEVPGDEVADFSSRGPVKKTYNIKPDVCAPGVDILSSYPVYGKEDPEADYAFGYAEASGTSMACPHVAGLSALIIEKNPNWTPFDVKVALMNNCKILDTEKFTVNDQGAGRVQALKTIQTEALAKVMDETTYIEGAEEVTKENITGSINFGDASSNEEGQRKIEKNILVKNLTEKSSEYTVSVDVTRPMDGVSIEVDTNSFTLENEQQIKVTLTVDQDIKDIERYQGYVKITNGTTNMNIPFIAYVNELKYRGLKYAIVEPEHFSPNEDWMNDATNVRFEFYNPIRDLFAVLWSPKADQNVNNGYIGVIGSNIDINLEENKPYGFEWDGKYYLYEEYYNGVDIEETVENGYYAIDIYAHDHDDNIYKLRTNYIFAETNYPQIVCEKENTTTRPNFNFTGEINSIYTDLAANEELELNIEECLTVKYTLTNSNDEKIVENGDVILNSDGSFNIPLENLTEGVNSIRINVDTIAGNTSVETAKINYDPEGTPVLAITDLEPGNDVVVKAGEDVKISFHAPEGGEGYFRILLPFEVSVTDEGIPMEEKSPGYYEGLWTAPEGIEMENLMVEVIYVGEGDVVLSERAKGRVSIVNEVEEPVEPEEPVEDKLALENLPANAVIVGNEAYDIKYLNNNSEAQMKLIEWFNGKNPVFIKLDETTIVNINGEIVGLDDLADEIIYFDGDGNTTVYQ